MPKPSERGVIHIFALLVLLAGLVGGIYLVKHPQIFSPKAGGDITRIEIVDNNGNPIPTTNTTKVKLKVTWVNNIVESSGEADIANFVPSSSYISARPNPCPLGNDGSASEKHCKTTIIWSTGDSDVDPIQVYVSRPGPGILIPKQLFAANRSGTQDANWIPAEGAIFELYSGATCTEGNIEGTSGCFYDAGTGTLLKSVQVSTDSASVFPQSFRVASSYEELAQAQERLFNGNPTTIDWELSSGAGIKVVYAQFNLGGVWGGLVKSSVELIGISNPTPPPFQVKLSADPTTVTSGQQTTLSWTIIGDVTSCDFSLGVSDSVSALGGQPSPIVTSGSKNITLTNSTGRPLVQTFTMACFDSQGNSAQASADVRVLPKNYTEECTINQFAQSFGSRIGDERFIKSCDVNYDGRINIYDIFDLIKRPRPTLPYPTPTYIPLPPVIGD